MGRVVALVAALAVAAAVAASVGTASRAAQTRQEACPYTRSPAPGWQATFGHMKTATAANALRTRAMNVGFQKLVVQASCTGDYEVALRGICPFSVAHALQNEARRAHFNVVLEYKKPMDPTPDLVVVFGHFRTRAAAADFLPRVESQGYKNARIYNDGGCDNDWEVLVGGLTSRGQAQDLENEARGSGFNATVEYA